MTIDPIRKLILGNTDALGDENKTEKTNAATSTRYTDRLQTYEDELVELDETSFKSFDANEADTDEIEKQIESKQEEIITLQEETESYVEKCRQEIENIITEGTDVIPKEVLNEFNEQSDNISGELRSNTTSMQELSSVISENEYAIERAQNEIEENEKEIKEKEDKIKSLQNKDDEASKQEIETLNEEIGALNSKISELNSIITNANKNIDTANNEYEEYSSKNTSLSEEQSGLMEKCMNKYYEAHTEEDRVYEDSFLKGQIEGLEDCISNAEINLSENTLNLTTEIENLKIQMRMYKNVVVDDIYRVVDLVGLESRIHDKVSKYSLGMRQRLGIAMALLHSPNLLVLDEPTNGLDPEGIKDLRVLLKRLAKNGVAILISSHNLSELESFCNRVCIISDGKVIEEASIHELKELDENKYILKINDSKKCKDFLLSYDKIVDANHIEVVKDEEEIAAFIKTLVQHDILIYEVTKLSMTLEEAFMKKARGDKHD